MADSGKDFPAGLSEDAMRCPRCGAKLAKGAKRCRYGHVLTKVEEAVVDPLDRRVEEAIAKIAPPKLGGIGKFDTKLHPHDRLGKFSHTYHAPKVGHHVMDVSSGLPARAEVQRVHPNGAVDVKAGEGHKHLEPHQYHAVDRAPKKPAVPESKVPKDESPEQMRHRQRDERWVPTEGVHPDLAAIRYSGPKALTWAGAEGHYTVRSEGKDYGGTVGRFVGSTPTKEPYYAKNAGEMALGRSIADAVKKLTQIQADQAKRDEGHPKSIPAALKSPRPLRAAVNVKDGTPEKQLILLKYARDTAKRQLDREKVAKLDKEIAAFRAKHNLKESEMDRRVARLVEAG